MVQLFKEYKVQQRLKDEALASSTPQSRYQRSSKAHFRTEPSQCLRQR